MAGQWQGQLPPLQVIKVCVPSLPSHRCDLKPDVNHLVRPRPVGKTTTIPVPCPRPFARAPPSEERPFARPCLLAPLSGHASFIPTLRGTWHLPETKSRSACRAEGKALGRGRSGRATPALAQGGDGPFRALRSPSERTRCNRVGPALLRAEPLFTPGEGREKAFLRKEADPGGHAAQSGQLPRGFALNMTEEREGLGARLTRRLAWLGLRRKHRGNQTLDKARGRDR